ncbi:MAG: lytic murein transglycosylase [Deltaproteobacteria bacterium]|nr:lytic murein transglycosylase [Deltaproteobacteria bacterium]
MPPCAKRVPSIKTIPCGRRFLLALGIAVFLLVFPNGAHRTFAADWSPLTERLAADGFNRQEVEALFARPEVVFEPDAMTGKIKELLRGRSAEPASLAATLRNVVRQSYLSRWVIARAQAYALANRSILEEIRRRYSVPKEIVVSILLIETRLGQATGNRCVFNRLASMAYCTDLESIRPYLDAALLTEENDAFLRRRCREKADWAYDELKALLLFADRGSTDPLGIRGSMYGAIGLCQFMPSNVFSYGVDADRDGRIDPFSKPDALHSIANYLKEHGWRKGLNREEQHRVIFAYNHSTVYANTVLAIAEKIRKRI